MKIYLGALSGIQYLGENEKEFSRSPFNPKPLVKNGDIVVLENIHAHNLSKLLPTEWKKLDKTFIEVECITTRFSIWSSNKRVEFSGLQGFFDNPCREMRMSRQNPAHSHFTW